ncbi:DUF5335 family protein [Rubrivirga sp. S365]|uniref:DUF5335 family protein n=1 Tax=Rubrivirga sp. S365 TaxID=3076080 RepID=UPI0028C7C9DB|nr:DUF5335 family protein [Rubrivirga sp. S365]MDT7855270.1 DUF5335 family protein [Rubrivirga sp. S365]
MATRSLDRTDWNDYFDTFSKDRIEGGDVGKAHVRVLSEENGDQVLADWLPLHGLTYDSKDDLFEVAMEGMDHLVNNPTEIHVKDDGDLLSFEVVRKDGDREIIELK